MKVQTIWMALFLAALLLLPAGFALGQSREAEIEEAKRVLDENPLVNNRLNLGTLQYLDGVDYLKSGDLAKAIDLMQAGVWTLEDSGGDIPATNEVFEEARYGLSYALVQNDKSFEALLVLDQLVQADPNYGKARYLLGATLIDLPGQGNVERGLDVLRQLAVDGRAPYKGWAARGSIRATFDHSTLTHAQGNAEGATSLLESAISDVGEGMGSSPGENDKIQYARGVYLLDGGDTMGGVSELETLHQNNSSFQLDNGVALAGVLSNAYYQAGVDQLEIGGESAAQVALDLFTSAGDVGDPDSNDVRHGKAIAHTILGDSASAAEELKAIFSNDPSYYNRIKK